MVMKYYTMKKFYLFQKQILSSYYYYVFSDDKVRATAPKKVTIFSNLN